METNEAANGLMLGLCLRLVRQPDAYPPPLCFMAVVAGDDLVVAALMTPPHKLIVYGHQGDLEAGAWILAGDLIRGGWDVPGVLGPSQVASGFAASWEALAGRAILGVNFYSVLKVRENEDGSVGVWLNASGSALRGVERHICRRLHADVAAFQPFQMLGADRHKTSRPYSHS